MARSRKDRADDGSKDDLAAYVPTPDEIREGCERIQATWTETQKRSRQTGTRLFDQMTVTEIGWIGTLDGNGV